MKLPNKKRYIYTNDPVKEERYKLLCDRMGWKKSTRLQKLIDQDLRSFA